MLQNAFCVLFGLVLIINVCAANIPEDWMSYIHPDTLKDFIGKNVSLQYDSNTFEGDITGVDDFASADEIKAGAKNIIIKEVLRWPRGIVPYTIERSFTTRPVETRRISRAMELITRTTMGCIKFKERTDEEDYVRFLRSVRCYSDVGRQGNDQRIGLTRGCMETVGQVQHEIMHALGLYHEVSRKDRDQYIYINWSNIREDDKRQFLIHADVETFELPYDYQSVMHYPITAFAVDTNLPTIVPKAKGARIGDSKYLTPNDVVKLQKTYKCYPGPDETDEDERPTTTQEPEKEDQPVDVSGSNIPILPGKLLPEHLWPHRDRIPYRISNLFRPEEKRQIEKALEMISNRTSGCIGFKLQTDEEDYIHFQHSLSCSSFVGRSKGRQVVDLSSLCTEALGDIQHKVLHALGVFHEHSRPDRDNYVQVIWDNIIPNMRSNFKILSLMNKYNLGYDLGSVMHYGPKDSARDPSLPTLVPKKASKAKMGQRDGLSVLDAAKLRVAYGCS